MKKLYLFTTGFPYPAKSMETYLETECRYYDRFSEVHILSMGVRKNTLKDKREVPGKNIHVHPVVFANKAVYILNGVTALGDKNFYKEIKKLKKEGRLSAKRLIRLIIYISRSHYDAGTIIRALGLKKGEKIRDAILYSYRFEYQPYVMLLLKDYFDRPYITARAHRYDLYEELNSDGYIPAREVLLDECSSVCLISDHGREYLEKKFPKYRKKLYVSRLGTLDQGVASCDAEEPFRIVSCSNMVPVKRIDKIIRVLSKVTDHAIEWVHFGSGELEAEMKELAAKCLPDNIHVVWKGRVPNAEVLRYYKETPVYLFVNLSDSEGIPVSIMETMSFGIPCLATDVGGTGEIVLNEQTGFLVGEKDENEKVSNTLKKILDMPEDEYQKLRRNARKIWEECYNADRNYTELIEDLLSK